MDHRYQEVKRLRQRMRELLDGPYELSERRIWAVVLLERVLQTVAPVLPAEYQPLMKEVLALHEQLWVP